MLIATTATIIIVIAYQTSLMQERDLFQQFKNVQTNAKIRLPAAFFLEPVVPTAI